MDMHRIGFGLKKHTETAAALTADGPNSCGVEESSVAPATSGCEHANFLSTAPPPMVRGAGVIDPMGLRARVRSAASVVVAIAALLAAPQGVQAQMPVTLVSTLGQQNNAADHVVGGSNPRSHATKFSVPSGADYTLTSVVVNLGAGGEVDVAIHAVSSTDTNNPSDTSLYQLTRPNRTSAGNRTFTAPAGAVLTGGTDYFVVISTTSTNTRSVQMTTFNGESGLAGWRVANDGRAFGNGSWGSGHTLRMRLTGYERLDATLSAVNYTFDANSHMLYRFDLVLTEAVAIGFQHMQDAAFTVANGTMVRARRLDKATRGGRVVASQWRMTVRAHTRSLPVTVSLPANRPCNERGAICTPGGTRLGNAPSLTLSTATVAGSAATSLSIADASAVENAAALNFTITLSSPVRSSVMVDFETLTTGTATADTDYVATKHTVAIPTGSRTWEVGVALIEDEDDDPDETVAVRISNARAIEHDGRPIVALGISKAGATGTITAPVTGTTNIPDVTMSIADAEANESDGWLRFDVTLSRPLDEYVCYDFETTGNGTATPEDDFAPRPKHTLWMSPGQVADRPFVRIYEDSIGDSGETVIVAISRARLCNDPSRRIGIARTGAIGEILNDDPMLRAWVARFGRTAARTRCWAAGRWRGWRGTTTATISTAGGWS